MTGQIWRDGGSPSSHWAIILTIYWYLMALGTSKAKVLEINNYFTKTAY